MIAAPMLVAATLAAVYLAFDPPSADLAAQTFRADLFEEVGWSAWNNAWYSGHHLPAYSLLFPALAAWLTPQWVGAISAAAAAGLFAVIARGAYGQRARLGALWFGAATATMLLSGRLTFALGVALGLAAMLAVQRRRPVPAVGLAALTALASPVAALFVALAGVAVAIVRRPSLAGRGGWTAALACVAGAVGATGALALAFPTGGVEPFVASAFWNMPLFCAAALVVLPGDERVLRWGVGLYALGALALFVIDTAVGGNFTRLGALFGGPVLALALAGRRPVALALLAAPLLFWQWSPAVRDVSDAVGDPSVERGFHAPLVERLDSLVVGAPVRVHVLPTRNRWEAVWVADHYPLARGWLRQAESDDFELFQDGDLTPDAYLAWLRDHAVSYVAVPNGVELDYLAEDEAELIADGLDFLDPLWESEDWKLYEVEGDPPFVSPAAAPDEPASDARVASLGPEGFEVTVDRPGSYLVRVNYTRYWEVEEGDACVAPQDGWTRVEARGAGVIRIAAAFSLAGLLGGADAC